MWTHLKRGHNLHPGAAGNPCYNLAPMDTFSSTTVLLVRRDGKTCMASDGQVTMNNSTIVKGGARKVRRAGKGAVLVGFAGEGVAKMFRLRGQRFHKDGTVERIEMLVAELNGVRTYFKRDPQGRLEVVISTLDLQP